MTDPNPQSALAAGAEDARHLAVPGWPEGAPAPHRFANIFRLMPPEERAPIGDSIREHGLREKIVMLDGMILDGRNRFLECLRVGRFAADVDWKAHPDFVSFGGLGWDSDRGTDPLAYVWDANDNRRHDSTSQRAMSAARYADMRQGERTDLTDGSSADLRKVSQAEAAERFGVSERLVSSASAVQEHGTPELQQAVDEGRIAVSSAEQVSRLSPEEQREIVEGERSEVRQKAKAARKPRERMPSNAELFEEVERSMAPERVAALPMVAFARFAQSVLNLARSGKAVAADTLVDLAGQNGIVRAESEGFVFTDEALAAMGTLAAGQPKQRDAEVRSPLPPAPSPGNHVEFTVGGLRDKASARFTVKADRSGIFECSHSYRFTNCGGGSPLRPVSARYEDAVATASFWLIQAFEQIINGQHGVVSDKEKAAARGALHWFGNKLAGWGVVAADRSTSGQAPGDNEDADFDTVAAAEGPHPDDAYQAALLDGAAHKGKHTRVTAEPIIRAGLAAERTGQQIADDLGHPIGTVLGWKHRLGLTGLGEGRAAPRAKRAAAAEAGA